MKNKLLINSSGLGTGLNRQRRLGRAFPFSVLQLWKLSNFVRGKQKNKPSVILDDIKNNFGLKRVVNKNILNSRFCTVLRLALLLRRDIQSTAILFYLNYFENCKKMTNDELRLFRIQSRWHRWPMNKTEIKLTLKCITRARTAISHLTTLVLPK